MRAVISMLLLSLFPFVANAETSFSMRPWTKNFLESSFSISMDYLAAHKRTSWQKRETSIDGLVLFSSAPCPDWQVDLAVAGKSMKTGKGACRVEKLIFSDLQGNPCALSCFLSLMAGQKKRIVNPVFFEMAQYAVETGMGIGKHLYIEKNFYTQAFSYLSAGAGKCARWGSVEVGLFQSFIEKHTFRCSLSHLKSFAHRQVFQGYGSIRTRQNVLAIQYVNRCNKVDVFFRYSKRWLAKGPLRSGESWTLGLSWDLFT